MKNREKLVRHCECRSYKKPAVVTTFKDDKGRIFVEQACCPDCFKVVVTDSSTTVAAFLR